MLKKYDNMRLVFPINYNAKVGEIFKIVDIGEYSIALISEETGERIIISNIGINKYFEKVEEADNKPLKGILYENIDKLMAEANIEVITFFDKTTVVVAQFPNGFVITESSSCVDPKDYSRKTGEEICLRRIKDRLYEMEAYHIQEMQHETENSENELDIENKKYNQLTDEIVNNVFENFFKEIEDIDNIYNFNPLEILKRYCNIYNVDIKELGGALHDKINQYVNKRLDDIIDNAIDNMLS